MAVVPLIIFQTWKTHEPPPKWKPLFDTWARFCKEYGYQHILYSDEDNRALIANDYPWFLEKYDSYKYPIQRADSVRYMFLHKYGGTYSDLDMCPKPDKFQEVHAMITKYGSMASAAMPITKNKFWKDTLTNSFMICQKGSPFMEEVWKSIIDPVPYHWTPLKRPLCYFSRHFSILLESGPGVISDQALLNPSLVVSIPECLIGNPDAPECLMTHVTGGSWHDTQQSNQEVIQIVALCIAVLLFIIFIIWFILWMLK